MTNPRNLDIDSADLWPRFYFDLNRGKLEVEAWLEKRGQRVLDGWVEKVLPLDWRIELLESL